MRNISRAYKNDIYSVQVYVNETEWGTVDQFVIRRHDEHPIHSWSELQRIKDELAGADRTAIEVFPAQRDLVDVANLYHLWVLPEGFVLPFGLRRRAWGAIL